MDPTESDCFVHGLTFAGHDFLDNARNEMIWDEVKADIEKKGLINVSIKMVMDLLNKKIRKKLDLD